MKVLNMSYFGLRAAVLATTIAILFLAIMIFLKHKMRLRANYYYIIIILAAVIIGIFSCITTEYAMTENWKRIKHYSGASEIPYDFIKQYIPDTAKDIIIKGYYGKFVATYNISENNLEDYYEKIWCKYADWHNVINFKKTKFKKIPENLRDRHNEYFESRNTTIPTDAIYYEGPMTDNGSMNNIYYDIRLNKVFQVVYFG